MKSFLKIDLKIKIDKNWYKIDKNVDEVYLLSCKKLKCALNKVKHGLNKQIYLCYIAVYSVSVSFY